PHRVLFRAEVVGGAAAEIFRIDMSFEGLYLSPLDLLYMPEHDDNAEAGELELRLEAAVRSRPEANGAAAIRLDLTRAPTWAPEAVSVAELLEILRVLRTLLDAARPLMPRDLRLPDVSIADPAQDDDLAQRAKGAVEALDRTAIDLAGDQDDATLNRGLLRAAHLGVAGALLGRASLRAHADLIAAEVAHRQASVAALVSSQE